MAFKEVVAKTEAGAQKKLLNGLAMGDDRYLIHDLYDEVRLMDEPTWATFQAVFELTKRIVKSKVNCAYLRRESASDFAQKILKSSLSDVKNDRLRDDTIDGDASHFYAILANKVLDTVRFHNRKKRAVSKEQDHQLDAVAAREDPINAEVRQNLAESFVELVEAAIQKEPKKRRLALELKFLLDFSNAEVLETLKDRNQTSSLRALQLWSARFVENLKAELPDEWKKRIQ